MSESSTHKGITVLVPTRERPGTAFQTYQSFKATKRLESTRIVFGVDYNEPMIEEYADRAMPVYGCSVAGSGSLSRVINELADTFPSDIQGMVNDDHRFRTSGWDIQIAQALKDKPGVAYGNDLLMGVNLPTSVFMSNEIRVGLGWFALPECRHMYLDNTWKDIGNGIGSLHYLPSVVIEHLHYTAGKSAIDESYVRTYGMMEPDGIAYSNWRNNGGYDSDIGRLNDYLRGLSEQEASIPPCEG